MSDLASKLYQDPRAWASDAIVEAECAREGIRDLHAIAARKAKARAADAALLAENDETVLPVSVYRDLRAANPKPEDIAARTALMHEHLAEPLRTPLKDVPSRVAALNADLVKRPALNAAMVARAAGYTVPVVRHLAELGAARADQQARAATAAKPLRAPNTAPAKAAAGGRPLSPVRRWSAAASR